MAEVPKGYLIIDVLEASAVNKEGNYVWSSANFEAYVKVELRGGSRNVKVTTRKAAVINSTIHWAEPLTLEVLENANELRVMLCTDKVVQTANGIKKGTNVIAACGIYVNDILDAVPIDKYFELFKPAAGGDGGFIRLKLDFARDSQSLPPGASNGTSSAAAGKRKSKSRGLWWKLPLALGVAAAAGTAGYHFSKKFIDERRKKK